VESESESEDEEPGSEEEEESEESEAQRARTTRRRTTRKGERKTTRGRHSGLLNVIAVPIAKADESEAFKVPGSRFPPSLTSHLTV
jgi:hypothetical protein